MKSRIGLASIVIGVVLASMASAHAVLGQEAPQDVLKGLLVEVRALRGAIEQMTAASARVQLAMGRLQLQEQRVNTLIRRLDELRQSRAAAERQASDQQAALMALEESLPRIADAGERRGLEQNRGELKAMLARSSADVQRMRAEETELSGVVSAEQSRWTDINQQLEDLDRTLRRQ